MTTLRVSAAAVFVSSVLVVAWSVSTEGCGGVYLWTCASPTGVNLGSADTTDGMYGDCPCTCCLSGPENGHPYPQGDCPFADAGEEPLPICSGQCVPLPPPGWTPVSLWIGTQNDAPECPSVAPVDVFDGYAIGTSDTFALACNSNASGSCSGLANVCGPATADNFRPCIMQAGNLDCVDEGPYPQRHVFDQLGPGEPALPTTFCCTSAPLMSPPQ